MCSSHKGQLSDLKGTLLFFQSYKNFQGRKITMLLTHFSLIFHFYTLLKR